MTKEEVAKIEAWVNYSVEEFADKPNEHRISFKPDIMLRDAAYSYEAAMRCQLAAYLRRIAQHLEA